MRVRHAIGVVVVVLVSLPVGVHAEDAVCGWQSVNPVPPRVDLVRVVNAISRFVAIGDDGIIVTSSDGLRWRRERSPTARDLTALGWGDGRFVAAGDRIVLWSALGHDWTVAWTAAEGVIRDLAWGDGRFVAVGSDLAGQLLVSDDGESWHSEPAPWTRDCDAVVWADEGFYASAGPELWASADGLEWSLVGDVPTAPAARAAAAAVAGKADLIGLDRRDFAWDGEVLYWFAERELWTSTDGAGWQLAHRADGCESVSAFDAVWASQSLVLATSHGACPSPFLDLVTTVWQSTNHGASWTQAWQGMGGGLGGLARWNTRIVGVGAGGDVVMTLGGAEWRCLEGACTSSACADGFYDVAVADDNLVAVGGVGLCDTPDKRAAGGTVARSADGVDWEVRETTGPRLLRIAVAGTVMVGVGDTWLGTSADGITWQENPVPDGMIVYDVAAADREFVAVGLGGDLARSSDGVDWSLGFVPTSRDLWRVDHVDGVWIAVGDGGAIVTSTDAITWQLGATSTTSSLRSATRGGGRGVAVGDDATVLVSDDGASWSRRIVDLPSNATLWDVGFGHGRFVAVGWRESVSGARAGVLLASIDGDSWTRFDPPGDELRRVVATTEGWLVAGGERTLLTAPCLGTLLTVEPAVIRVGSGQEVAVRVRLELPYDSELELEIELNPIGVVTSPERVLVPAGSREVGFRVVGRVPGEATMRIKAPAELGGGRIVADIVVRDGLWNRRPSGRVGP